MSQTPWSYLLGDSARKMGDPNMTRIRLEDWLVFANESQRELCQRLNLLKFRGIFTLETSGEYAYPENMTQLSRVESTDTPSDQGSWRSVDEKFEDEFRLLTQSRYPDASLPSYYFADVNWYYLIPKPSVKIVGGGRLTFFGTPERIFNFDGNLQPPPIAEDYIIRRMVVYALQARNRHAEANAVLQQWYTDVDGLAEKMEDRSEDRRAAIRPPIDPYRGMR